MPPSDQTQSSGITSNAPTILLIRHATTPLNKENRIRGWSDVDIDPDRGRDDTLKTAQVLQHIPVSEIVSSDLSRAEQTASILSNQWFVPTTADRNLRPWNLGELTGEKLDSVKDDMNYHVEHPDKKVPGGERFNDFLGRWKEGLSGLAARAMQSPTGVVAGVTHSRNIEATRFLLSGNKDTSSLISANSIPPSGVMALQIHDGNLTEVPFENQHLTKDE